MVLRAGRLCAREDDGICVGGVEFYCVGPWNDW